MNSMLVFTLVCGVCPVLMIVGYVVALLVTQFSVRDRAETLNLEITHCIRTNNSDVHLMPKWNTIYIGISVGLLMAIWGVALAIGTVTSPPAGLGELCGFLLFGLGLAAFGVIVILYAGRGLSLPRVHFSFTSQTVTLRPALSGQTQTYPLNQIADFATEPVEVNNALAPRVLATIMEFMSAMGSHGRVSGQFDAKVPSQQMNLVFVDGHKVRIALVTNEQAVELRRILGTVITSSSRK